MQQERLFVEEERPFSFSGEREIELGTLWQLGQHVLMCGDCTDAEDMKALMDGHCADCVLTDPPYGQNQEGVSGDEPENLNKVISVLEDLPIVNAVVTAFQSPRTLMAWMNKAAEAGLQFERMLWLYKKAQMSFPWRGWLLKSEAILLFSKGEPHWNDVKPYHHDVYELPYVSKELPAGIGWHGSVKPLSVVTDLLNRTSRQGDIVLDPFGGSGTTLIAAEQIQRTCCMMEIEPKNCEVIIKRWEITTGQKAANIITAPPARKGGERY